MQALSRIRFLFFLFLQQRLNYWPCLPVHILTNVTKKTEERCVNSLYGPHYHVPNKEKQQILRKWRIFNIINPIDIIDNWYTWYNEYNYNMIIINDNCHDQSFVHVFSQRTFLCALQFRSFHLKYFLFLFFFRLQIISPYTCTPLVVPSWGWTVSRCERSLQSHVHCLAHWRANSENILWSTPPK